MRYLLLLPLTLLLTLVACKSDKDRMAEIVEEWQGREIKFPEVMTDFLTGDTIDLSDADFTIFTYVDSVGCTGCKMKLQFWKLFLNSLDSICDANVKVLMIADGVDINELNYNIKRYDFDFPIYLDTIHHMGNSHNIPAEIELQTFLLDRNKRVVIIGSPIYSYEIMKAYSDLISGKSVISSDITTFLNVEPNRIFLGSMHPGDSICRLITIINPSDDYVRIREIMPSCDCIRIEFKDSIIPPETQIDATLKSYSDSTIGMFDRSIHIYYENFDYPSVITVVGKITQ